jgi:trans-o-hydroxybenzylidenepyruvate hydratase-aldolase
MMRKRDLLQAADISGLWVILPTPATPDAGRWDAVQSVDLGETARVVENLIAAGVDGLLSLGTYGEGATVTWDEKVSFVSTVAETVNGRVPFFAGTTSLNTRESIRQGRALRALGADGTLLGLPMWVRADLPTAVQFYRDVAEACPDLAICVYANHEAFKFEFTPAFWAAVDQIPQTVSVKCAGIGRLDLELQLTKSLRFLPNEGDYYAAARLDPERCTAFWSSGALCGPATPLRLRDEVELAKKTGNWELARAVSGAMHDADRGFFPNGSFADFSKYNVVLEKERMNAGGWMTAGPTRPPYTLAPEEYVEAARVSGRAWAALHKQYAIGQGAQS